MRGNAFEPGDWVIYRKTKFSTCPGPRAMDVAPSQHGDLYSYIVDKFWIVCSAENGAVRLRTRRGKEHVVDADDPNLRKASWWERLRFRGRFASIEETEADMAARDRAATN